MQFYTTICLVLATLNAAASAIARAPISGCSNSTHTSTVYQFSSPESWIEGISVRRNGKILVTRTDVPELWSIDPKSHTASLIYAFPDATSTVGITEISPDTFAVVTGTIDLATTVATSGSFSVWEVSFRSYEPKVRKIKAIPEADSLSGMVLLRSNILLIADTKKGVVWRLNIATGVYSVALSDASMLPVPNLPPIGINGIKVLGKNVYYTSSTQQKFCRVPINMDGSAAGPYEVVASGFFQDGFALQSDGTALIATHPQNTIVQVSPQGVTSVVAGHLNSTLVAGATDAYLTDSRAGRVLYVSTNGAKSAPVNGTYTEPAKLVKIDLTAVH